MITVERLSDVFVEVADSLVADFDLTEFLHSLTQHAAAVSGADAAGIVIADHRGQLHFMAATSDSGRDMELFQLQDAEGPCRDCFDQGVPVTHLDLADGTTPWPSFAPRAVEAGFRSVHAFPMRLRGEVIGALNLFSRTASAFDTTERRIVQALADVSTVAVLHERNTARAEAVAEQLQGALNSRVVIEQAKGVLAQRHSIDVDAAFSMMRDEARHSRRRVADVAAEIAADPSGRGTTPGSRSDG